ncbi:type II secretion system protein GspM [Hyphomonas oceanitis]|uniref:General secretion pathway protein n=1 Tax=Hyphomonas oceanitis SCH89 TaxID=1280953 RepID=A0A059G504_9PROT|nr:type II secretion system protein GspM [Hyphomonas oceanitis]KDA01871.1 general secretion pathway protein [Hyphomonas oceanitis SCH89]
MNFRARLPQLKGWWETKNLRDKWLLGGTAGVFVAVAWWSLVWAPLQDARSGVVSRIARIEMARITLAGLPQDARLTGDEDGSPTGLRETVSATASALKLPVQRIEQSSGRIVVTFDTAEFEQIMRWLDILSRDHAITVVQADILRRTAPGMVSAELTLERI